MNIPYNTAPYVRRAFELVNAADDLIGPRPVKPMNTRTRKTVWKERVRRANLPRSMQKRLAKRSLMKDFAFLVYAFFVVLFACLFVREDDEVDA